MAHYNFYNFSYNYKTLATAMWYLYPTQAFPHVKETYMIDHRIIPDRNQLLVTRLGRLKNKVPPIACPLVGDAIEYYVIERILIDGNNKRIHTNVKGVTKTDFYRYYKEINLKPRDDDSMSFECHQEFNVTGFGPLNSAINKVCTKMFAEYVHKNSDAQAIKEAIDRYVKDRRAGENSK